MRRLGILKEFDKTSQSYEIRKYCKNIGMQKLTFEECSISLQSTDLVHFFLHESKFNLCREKKTKSEKCGFESQKCLAKYWLESFFDQNVLFAI